MTDDCGVVIVTRNRKANVLEVLEKMRDGHPVVVVDNGSDDGTTEAVRTVPGVRAIALERNLGSAARNVGVAALATRYVAFCDDDSWWEPGAVSCACKRADGDASIGAVVGRVVVEPSGQPCPVTEAIEASRSVTGFLACSVLVRRDAFTSVGGFHPHFGIGAEERLFAMKLLSAGWKVVYEPLAVVRHAPADRGGATRRRRSVQAARNAVWTAWLRRPAPAALLDTWRAVAANGAAGVAGAGLALAGLPWVLREREVNTPVVERLYREASGHE